MMRTSRLILILLSFLVFPPVGRAAAEVPGRIPAHIDQWLSFDVEYDPPAIPWPMIKVQINGQEPVLLMIDTGQHVPLVLDAAVAPKLKLPPGGGLFIITPPVRCGIP